MFTLSFKLQGLCFIIEIIHKKASICSSDENQQHYNQYFLKKCFLLGLDLKIYKMWQAKKNMVCVAFELYYM